RGHTLCKQGSLIIRHLLKMLLVDLLLHIRGCILHKPLYMSKSLKRVKLGIVASIVSLCILRIHLLIISIKRPHSDSFAISIHVVEWRSPSDLDENTSLRNGSTFFCNVKTKQLYMSIYSDASS